MGKNFRKGKADYLKNGDYNAICDVCGFKYKASELRRRWDNFMVCPEDFEHRHPQDFLKSKRDDQSVPWSSPEQTDDFVTWPGEEGVWTSRFGPENWSLSTGVWTGVEYHSAFIVNRTQIRLRELGTWVVNARPRKIKISWHMYQAERSPSELEIISDNDDEILGENPPFSTGFMVYDLDFSDGEDMKEFKLISDRIQPNNDEIFRLTNIEFLDL